MQRVLKGLVLIIMILGILCYSNNVYAVSEENFSISNYTPNMNLGNNTTKNNTTTNRNENDNKNNTVTNTTGESANSQETTTRITVNTEELRISNLLSICLIAVGVVIILLAIAILIKLKR